MFAIMRHRLGRSHFIKLPIFAVYMRFAKSGQAIATRKFCEARRRPLMCWFLEAGNHKTLHTPSEPASKKRQGTKSRDVWHPAGQRALWISQPASVQFGDWAVSSRFFVGQTTRPTPRRLSIDVNVND
jgi:hypothetical protein